MSENEINKGKLIPLNKTTEELASIHLSEEDRGDYNKLEDKLYDIDIREINGKYYKVEYEIKSGDAYGFVDVEKNDDGSFNFHTMHYNGGGDLIELLEGEIK